MHFSLPPVTFIYSFLHLTFNFIILQTSNASKKKKAKASDSDESSDSSDHEAVLLSYKSKRDVGPSGPSDMGATATIEIETEIDRDAQAQFERALAINKVT